MSNITGMVQTEKLKQGIKFVGEEKMNEFRDAKAVRGTLMHEVLEDLCLEFAGKEAFEITGAIDKGVSNSNAGNSSDEASGTAQAGVGYSQIVP